MPESIESAIVLLLFAMPGFVVGRVERVIRPTRSGSDIEWIFGCVLRSVLLLLPGAALLYLNHPTPGELLQKPLGEISELWSFGSLLLLTVTAYVLAFCWGLALCFGKQVSIHGLAQKISKSGVTNFDSVWANVMATRLQRDDKCHPKCPWLRLKTGDGTEILGRLRNSTTYVDLDKPIEVFLQPAFVVNNGELIAMPTAAVLCDAGIYMKVTDDIPIRIYLADPGWTPDLTKIKASTTWTV